MWIKHLPPGRHTSTFPCTPFTILLCFLPPLLCLHHLLLPPISMNSSRAPLASSCPTTGPQNDCGRSASSTTPSSGRHRLAQTHGRFLPLGTTRSTVGLLSGLLLQVLYEVQKHFIVVNEYSVQVGFPGATSKRFPGNWLQVPLQRADPGPDQTGQRSNRQTCTAVRKVREQEAHAAPVHRWR